MDTKIFRIKTARLKGGDLLLAYSDDLKGFSVHGRSHEELEQRIPIVIRELLEMAGYAVESVELERDNEDKDAAFIPTALIASAALCARNDHRRILAGH